MLPFSANHKQPTRLFPIVPMLTAEAEPMTCFLLLSLLSTEVFPRLLQLEGSELLPVWHHSIAIRFVRTLKTCNRPQFNFSFLVCK